MVNFGPLAAEIVSLVWGTPANFNGFGVLAALLHGILVVRRWTEGATYIRQGGITLGIGLYSSLYCHFYKLSNVLFECHYGIEMSGSVLT